MARNGSHFTSSDWDNFDSPSYDAYNDTQFAPVSYQALDGSYVTADGYVRKRKRRRRSVAPVVAFVVVLLLGLVAIGGFFGFRLLSEAREVKAQAKEVVALVEDVPDAILAGDTASLPQTANQVSSLAGQINNTVHGTLWNIASYLPYVGSDIKSAQVLGDTLVDLSANALVPVSNSLQGLDLGDLIANRRINIEKLSLLTGAIGQVTPVIERAAATIDALPTANIQQVRDYIEKVREPLSEINDTLSEVSEFTTLLPQVFGSTGTRTYMVIAMNSAELRSSGGLPGAFGFVTVSNGYIEVGDFGSVGSLSEETMQGRTVSETAEERAFFVGVDLYARYAELTFLPEFERVGELAMDYAAIYWPDVAVDGVMAVDPTFLQHLMAVTGASAQVEGVTLDGTSANRVLIHDVYTMYDADEVNTKSNEFFTEAADACVEAVFDNLGNMGLKDLTDLLTGNSEEGHFFLWMDDDTEQAAVRKLSFSGNLDYDAREPQLGVYLNDHTWSKIDWYLGCLTEVGEGYINGQGGTTYEVTTYIKNNLTEDMAMELPRYITGVNNNKYRRDDIMTDVYLFAPYGGTITDIEISYTGDGDADAMILYRYEGTVWQHQGHYMQFHQLGQGVVTIKYKVNTAYEAEAPLTVRQTPMAQEGYGSVTYAWDE